MVTLVLLGLLGYVATAPPSPASFRPDALPPGASGLYAVEHAEGFDFRWTQPLATIPLRISMPGRYRLTLGLLDGSPAAGSRAVHVAVNGAVIGVVYPTSSPQDFTFAFVYPLVDWRPGQPSSVDVELRTDGYTPPNDPRALGVALTSVIVQPSRPFWLLLPRLLLVYAAGLAVVIGYGRFCRLPLVALGLALGVVVSAIAPFAIARRGAALFWLAQPTIEPLWWFGAALLLAPLGLLTRGIRADRATSSVEERDSPPPNHAHGTIADRFTLAVAVLTLSGLALRLWRLDQLSLWLDEGFTVMYSHLPWVELLGLRGQYDVHPPLYYAVVKVVSALAPDVLAGRVVSAVSGALLIPVSYRLTKLLVGARSGLIAAVVVAIAPVHVWYSREARMYTMALLAVGLSYLALTELLRGGHWGWQVVYGTTALIALYTDFSALFALAPQLFVLVLLWSRRRAAAAIAGALYVLALAAFLPWGIAVFQRVGGIATQQAYFLGATWTRIVVTFLGITGVNGGSVNYWGDVPTPWSQWPALRPLLVPTVALVAAGGLRCLWKRQDALLVSAALLLGTFGTAILVSLVAPSFTFRTVIYALLGWAIVVGAAASTQRYGLFSKASHVALVGLLVAYCGVVYGIYNGATKEDFRGLAHATALAARSGQPILTDGPLMNTFIDVYQPGLRGPTFATMDGAALPPGFERTAAATGQFWFVYGDFPWMRAAEIRNHFAAMGYRRVSHQFFPDALFLDHFVRGTSTAERTVPCLPPRDCPRD